MKVWIKFYWSNWCVVLLFKFYGEIKCKWLVIIFLKFKVKFKSKIFINIYKLFLNKRKLIKLFYLMFINIFRKLRVKISFVYIWNNLIW